jgi:hypothetical protein
VFPYLLLHRRRCTRVRTRLPLLQEERAASPVDFGAGCQLLDAPPRVVVRFRAIMERPTRWAAYKRDYLMARGNALEAFVAVRTHPTRRPIAFASFARDGSARLFRGPRCTE